MLGQGSNQHGFPRSRRARSDLSSAPKRAQRAQAGIIALLGLAAARAFLSAPCHGRVTRFADPKSRPASLLYEEEEAHDEEIDDNFDEITIDAIDSLTSLDDDDEDFGLRPKRPIKADVHPKFKRAGYFERQDLNRLDVSEFDQQGELQRLSIDDLERRLETRFGVSDRAKPRPREPLTERVSDASDSEDLDDYDLFWKPGRRELRPAKPSRPLRPARPMAQLEVMPTLPTQLKETQQNVKGRPRNIQSWLLDKENTRRKQNKKEDSSESSDRIGTSTYRKMYKAVMRNYGPLPWNRVEGLTSWLDPANKSWEELGLKSQEGEEMLELMKELGVLTPNRLQGLALPDIMSGKDVMLTSTTGSGKTLAFLLPLLEKYVLPLARGGVTRPKSKLPHHLAPKVLSKPKILVVAPGRELSRQISRVVKDLLSPFSPTLNVTVLVGKDNHKRQDENLRDRQPVVVVGTPGKLMDHAMEGRLILNELNAIVIDEVDSLLSMSRQDHVELLLQHLGINDQAQRILVSASGSMEGDAIGFAEAILRDGWKLVGPKHGMELPKRVLHLVNGAPDVNKKLGFLKRLSTSSPECNMMLVFCNNHERVRKVSEQMNERKIPTEFLTGNRTKEARDRAIRSFVKHEVQALVATDAAMRGLDFRDLTHVVNFELPGNAATYAHRAGRCGRMGYNGIVINLASGGYLNKRLRNYSRQLDFEVIEANVNDGVLGADLAMAYRPKSMAVDASEEE